MGKHILLINDLPGYGKVALAAMQPVLSHMGHHLYNLPTALVSNTLDYGKFDILETTAYMRNTIGVWKQLGFSFDAVSTGFIVSIEQARLVSGYCRELSALGAKVFVDPIMGDEGKLYNGITEKTVGCMRELVAVADYTVPNYTEAAFLTGTPCTDRSLSREEAVELVDKMRGLGAKSVAITSAFVEGKSAVVGWDAQAGAPFELPFELIPTRFAGTGDIFSAVMMGRVLDGWDLPRAVQSAMDAVAGMISRYRDNRDKFVGVPVESCLELLDR